MQKSHVIYVVESANDILKTNNTKVCFDVIYIFGLDTFLGLYDNEFSVQEAHFRRQSIGISCMMVARKMAKLFTFYFSVWTNYNTLVTEGVRHADCFINGNF